MSSISSQKPRPNFKHKHLKQLKQMEDAEKPKPKPKKKPGAFDDWMAIMKEEQKRGKRYG